MLGQTNIIALVGGGRMPKFAANKVSIYTSTDISPHAH